MTINRLFAGQLTNVAGCNVFMHIKSSASIGHLLGFGAKYCVQRTKLFTKILGKNQNDKAAGKIYFRTHAKEQQLDIRLSYWQQEGILALDLIFFMLQMLNFGHIFGYSLDTSLCPEQTMSPPVQK